MFYENQLGILIVADESLHESLNSHRLARTLADGWFRKFGAAVFNMPLSGFFANSVPTPTFSAKPSRPPIGNCIEPLIGSKYARLGFPMCR